MRISFHRLAERELNDAALYYERESTRLGVKFLDEVNGYINSILKNPSAGRIIRGPVRRRILSLLEKNFHSLSFSLRCALA